MLDAKAYSSFWWFLKIDEFAKKSNHRPISNMTVTVKLPFGIKSCRIHTLAGLFSQQMPPEFEEAERGFWAEIFEGAKGSLGDRGEEHSAGGSERKSRYALKSIPA